MNPFGGVALDVLCDLAWRDGGRRHGQGMNMIVNAADLHGGHVVMARDAAHVFPYPLLDLCPDVGHAILGAEDDVVEEACVGVWPFLGLSIQASLRDEGGE